MKAPKYIDNSLFTFLERARQKKKHLDAIFNIKQTNRLQSDLSEHLKNIEKFQSKQLISQYQVHKRKFETIEKKNEQILSRILSISMTDRRKAPKSGRLRSLGSFSKNYSEGKSLNVSFRKQQAEKITSENRHLAQRLMAKTPSHPRNQVLKEFNEHEIYKNRIRKMTPLNTLKIRGLDNETSRCISSISGNNKISNQSFSEKSIFKKTEDTSLDSKLKANKNLLPLKNKEKVLGDFIFNSKPKQTSKKKGSMETNESSSFKNQLEEMEIKGVNKGITPRKINLNN